MYAYKSQKCDSYAVRIVRYCTALGRALINIRSALGTSEKDFLSLFRYYSVSSLSSYNRSQDARRRNWYSQNERWDHDCLLVSSCCDGEQNDEEAAARGRTRRCARHFVGLQMPLQSSLHVFLRIKSTCGLLSGNYEWHVEWLLIVFWYHVVLPPLLFLAMFAPPTKSNDTPKY